MPDDLSPSPPSVSRHVDRSIGSFLWYRVIQGVLGTILSAMFGLRVTGRKNIPKTGASFVVSNHLSHLDSVVLGILLDRPLNYMARSGLFFWPLGPFIRSIGSFPINREGMGAEGFKETLRRLRSGGIVTLFPEGTRTEDGEIAELKPGIARLVIKAKVAIVPAAIAGTFEAWPRTRIYPVPHPIRVHFGPPVLLDEIAGLDSDALTALIGQRIRECQVIARGQLARDMAID